MRWRLIPSESVTYNMKRTWLIKCIYRCPAKNSKYDDGHECLLERAECRWNGMEPMDLYQFRHSGECCLYQPSHPVDEDGAKMEEDKNV